MSEQANKWKPTAARPKVCMACGSTFPLEVSVCAFCPMTKPDTNFVAYLDKSSFKERLSVVFAALFGKRVAFKVSIAEKKNLINTWRMEV